MIAEQSDDTATIARDVERTQDDMGATIDRIEERLSPRGIAQSLLSDENADTARGAWEVIRESPLPVALMVGGAAWLVATSRAPMIARLRDELKSRFNGAAAASRTAMRSDGEESAQIGPPLSTGEAYDRKNLLR